MGRVRSKIKNVARALCVGASTGAGTVYLFGAGGGTVSIQFLVVGVVFSKGAGVDFELKLL